MERKTYLIPGQKKKFSIIIVISSPNSLSTTKSQNPSLVYFAFFFKETWQANSNIHMEGKMQENNSNKMSHWQMNG